MRKKLILVMILAVAAGYLQAQAQPRSQRTQIRPLSEMRADIDRKIAEHNRQQAAITPAPAINSRRQQLSRPRSNTNTNFIARLTPAKNQPLPRIEQVLPPQQQAAARQQVRPAGKNPGNRRFVPLKTMMEESRQKRPPARRAQP